MQLHIRTKTYLLWCVRQTNAWAKPCFRHLHLPSWPTTIGLPRWCRSETSRKVFGFQVQFWQTQSLAQLQEEHQRTLQKSIRMADGASVVFEIWLSRLPQTRVVPRDYLLLLMCCWKWTKVSDSIRRPRGFWVLQKRCFAADRFFHLMALMGHLFDSCNRFWNIRLLSWLFWISRQMLPRPHT